MRTLASLGKNTTADTSSSFLRRIESGALKARPDPRITARQIDPFLRKRPEKRKASPEPDKGTPAWIKRRIEASFEVAARNLADKTKVRHPTKRNVKVVDSYPLIPDLDAFPDSGAYVTVKFSTGPVASGDRYDTRLLAGIFKPIERSTAEDAAYATALEAHERDPASNPKPHNMMSYDLFLPKDADTGDRFRQCFDVDNPDRDDPALYPPKGFFGFPRLRPYETSQEKEMDHETKYNEEVILAFREDNEVQGGKVVFYYPVMQRSTIRNQRTKNIARTIGITDDDELPRPDELHVTVSEPSEALKKDLANLKNDPLGYSLDQDEEAEEDEDAEGGANANGHGPPVPNGHQSTQPAAASDEDLDAEGDDD